MRLRSGWQEEDGGTGGRGRICKYSYEVSREFPPLPHLPTLPLPSSPNPYSNVAKYLNNHLYPTYPGTNVPQ